MTTGEALSPRTRDVTVTETSIRTRLRIKHGPQSILQALAIVDDYVNAKVAEHGATPVTTSNGAQIVREPQFALTRFVRLSVGRNALMYELRYNGATMQARYVLHIGYALDDRTDAC